MRLIGTGGLGHPIISRSKAAMGVGTLRIIDRDVIELSNLHRQTLFEESDVGKVKVETVANKLKKMGVGTLRIIDRDVIELSNLHRDAFEESDESKP